MMKFLKDDLSTCDTAGESVSSPLPDEQVSGEDVSQQQGYLTVSANDKSVRRSTILLAVVFAAGLLCLFFMVKKTRPAPVSGQAMTEDARIETAMAKLTGIKKEFIGRVN